MPLHQKTITPHDVVALLNEAVQLDPTAMHALVESRVPCNDALADHPTIQVSAYDEQTGEPTPGKFKVGLLGILNGMFGKDAEGWGYIAAVFDVVCENCHIVSEGASVGDECPECGTKLTLGSLTSFEVRQ